MLKHLNLKGKDLELLKKAEEAIAETVVHRNPFITESGIWPFVVVGPDDKGMSVIRTGSAEQAKIQASPLYIATLGGDYLPDSDGVPIEELAEGDFPEELAGLTVSNITPLRPLSITSKKAGPPMPEALDEVLDFYMDNRTAIIETPSEAYWALSVLKYLDESDRFFPDPVLENFYSKIGQNATRYKNSSGSRFSH
jgi:hypothetical protein